MTPADPNLLQAHAQELTPYHKAVQMHSYNVFEMEIFTVYYEFNDASRRETVNYTKSIWIKLNRYVANL